MKLVEDNDPVTSQRLSWIQVIMGNDTKKGNEEGEITVVSGIGGFNGIELVFPYFLVI